jgi:DNA gyrase subunit A
MTDQPDQPENSTPDEQLDPDAPADLTVDLAIEEELADSYLTYAMSTIVDRALPDARDGLKPSQRRILVAMNDLNLSPGRKHSKCAGIVGETMKKYHPHGEGVIYPTLVAMAQDWKFRYVLVNKQGNFGSIDPDPPAAMRYTEARMHQHAVEMLDDLKLDTVDWQPNFDESVDEPRVLPAKLPNLLVNGSTGIAVGMACNIPPHNLGEVCDGVIAYIDNPDVTVHELMELIPGPDFPTGGIICGRRGIAEAYATGRGRITLRAKVHHETKGNRDVLVVTQIPYQVSKNAGIVDKIVECRKQDRITDVSNIVDESSNRTGMRVVIELKRGADPTAVENQLYRLTPLQSTYSILNIALNKGQPQTLNLRDLIRLYVEHREEVVRRRTAFRLREATHEAHRIEGLIYAVCDIDEVIKLIRESRTRDEAIEKLMQRHFRIGGGKEYGRTPEDHKRQSHVIDLLAKYSFVKARVLTLSGDIFGDSRNDQEGNHPEAYRLSRTQAEAIGRLQLIQLIGLEVEKLIADFDKLLEQIENYESILADRDKLMGIIRDETLALQAKHADPRRTQIEEEVGDLNIAALTPVEQVVVTITHGGYVKRLPADEYRTQGRGGRGVIGANAKDDDFTEQVFVASTHDDLLCFTNTGRVYKIKVYEIPEAPRTSRGRAIINLIDLRKDERICNFMPIEDFEREEAFLCFATRKGITKRTALKDYRNVNRSGIIAINLREGDELIGVTWTSGEDNLLLGTAKGMAIRFSEDDSRVMGRNASGVKGIALGKDDRVVGLVRCVQSDTHDLLTVTTNGYGKRTPLEEYLVRSEDGSTRTQGRGGKGRRDIATTKRNGEVVKLLAVNPGDDLMLISSGGMIVRISAGTIRQTGRGTQGVRVINLVKDDALADIARVAEESDEEEQAQETAAE